MKVGLFNVFCCNHWHIKRLISPDTSVCIFYWWREHFTSNDSLKPKWSDKNDHFTSEWDKEWPMIHLLTWRGSELWPVLQPATRGRSCHVVHLLYMSIATPQKFPLSLAGHSFRSRRLKFGSGRSNVPVKVCVCGHANWPGCCRHLWEASLNSAEFLYHCPVSFCWSISSLVHNGVSARQQPRLSIHEAEICRGGRAFGRGVCQWMYEHVDAREVYIQA